MPVKLSAFLGVLVLLPLTIWSDMGAIVPTGAASIAEPSQKALILHNGEEEVLILGTDIQSSQAGALVRFIPLPSRPSISEAGKNLFENLNKLIKKFGLQYVMQTKGPAELRPVEELVLNKKIGAHSVTVIRVKSAAHFREWASEFLRKNGLPVQGLDMKVEAVAADYIARKFNYFVFDIIRPEPDAKSVDPILYRFPSKKLYYPLKTSNLYGGKGAIDLTIVAPTARDLYSLSTHYYQASTTAVIDPAMLSGLYSGSVRFFKTLKGKKPVLQVIRFDGDLKFENDIWTDARKGLKELKPVSGF